MENSNEADILLKLIQHGFVSSIDIACSEAKNVAKRCQVPLAAVLKLQTRILESVGSSFMPADSLLQRSISTSKLFSSGLESVDKLLEDGLQSSQILLITGPSMSGKTKISSHFCMEALMNSNKVVWINIGNQLNVEYLKGQLESGAETKDKESKGDESTREYLKKVLNNLQVFEVVTQLQLFATLKHIETSSEAVDLIVIDSLTLFTQLNHDWCNENKSFFGALKESVRIVQQKLKCAFIMTSWVQSGNESTKKYSLADKMLFHNLIDYQILLDCNENGKLC